MEACASREHGGRVSGLEPNGGGVPACGPAVLGCVGLRAARVALRQRAHHFATHFIACLPWRRPAPCKSECVRACDSVPACPSTHGVRDSSNWQVKAHLKSPYATDYPEVYKKTVPRPQEEKGMRHFESHLARTTREREEGLGADASRAPARLPVRPRGFAHLNCDKLNHGHVRSGAREKKREHVRGSTSR